LQSIHAENRRRGKLLASLVENGFVDAMNSGYGLSKEESERVIKELREAGKKIRRTPETARAFLIKHGFITKGGKLTKRYGG
jgi:hypothetical protein